MVALQLIQFHGENLEQISINFAEKYAHNQRTVIILLTTLFYDCRLHSSQDLLAIKWSVMHMMVCFLCSYQLLAKIVFISAVILRLVHLKVLMQSGKWISLLFNKLTTKMTNEFLDQLHYQCEHYVDHREREEFENMCIQEKWLNNL